MADKSQGRLKKFLGIAPDTKLSPMLAYNSAVFLSGGSFYIIGIYFLSFLTYVEGLSATQAGIVVLCAKLCDAISDPIMGVITDHTRSRFGKHRKYILIGIIPVAVSYFCMWYSFGISAHGNTTATMIYYIFAYVLFSTAYTVVIVPHTAMFPEIAPEYSLRTQYNAVKTILDAVGSYSSFIISAILFGFFETEKFTSESRSKFLIMGSVLCLWLSLPLLYTFFGTHEPSSLNEPKSNMTVRSLIGEYKSILSDKCFRQYFILSLFNGIALGFVSNTSYYFIRNVAQQPSMYSLLTTVAGVAEAAGFPLNYMLSIKVGKQVPARLMLPMMLVAFTLALFVNPSTPVWYIFLIFILYNLGLSGANYVTNNLFPDVADVDYMITGRHREGTLATFSTFIKKTISGLMATLTGFILTGFGFDTTLDAAEQTAKAIWGIKFTYAIIPMVFIGFSIYCSFKYKMRKKEHDLIRRAIAQKEENGTAVLTESEQKTLENIAGKPFETMWIAQGSDSPASV